MSIPKEPRQLMINLMYLVLTAMLALNVSAEIINAFFALNKGMKTSSAIVDVSNTRIKGAIDKTVEAYKTAPNLEYQADAAKAQQISKNFEAYIADLTAQMTKEAGGPSKEFSDGRPERFKDKDIPTRMFITDKKGDELQAKIAETRAAFLALVKDPSKKAEMEQNIALKVDSIAQDSKAKTWSEYKFKQMPVAAVMPTLTKFAADAKTSETALLNYFFNLVGGTDIKFDNFKVAIAPKKSYLIRGDKFEADVYLAAYSSNPGGISISVNGSGLPLNAGVAHYETTPGGVGKQQVNATANITNPLTHETKTVSSTFEYEVGEKSATVSADKMNVLYIGVDNPISVSAAGVSSNDIHVSGTGCNIRKEGNGYVATASSQGKAIITVSAPGGMSVEKEFRVKLIPNPVPTLSGKKGGGLGSGEMRGQGGVIAILENFDFNARCLIESFQLVKQHKGADVEISQNSGASFNDKASRMVTSASPGDTYSFFGIRAKCPGDVASRDLGSMSFFIK